MTTPDAAARRRRARREDGGGPAPLALSLLDIVSAGFGSAIFLFVVFASLPVAQPTPVGVGGSEYIDLYLEWGSAAALETAAKVPDQDLNVMVEGYSNDDVCVITSSNEEKCHKYCSDVSDVMETIPSKDDLEDYIRENPNPILFSAVIRACALDIFRLKLGLDKHGYESACLIMSSNEEECTRYCQNLTDPAASNDGGADDPLINAMLSTCKNFTDPAASNDGGAGDLIIDPILGLHIEYRPPGVDEGRIIRLTEEKINRISLATDALKINADWDALEIDRDLPWSAAFVTGYDRFGNYRRIADDANKQVLAARILDPHPGIWTFRVHFIDTGLWQIPNGQTQNYPNLELRARLICPDTPDMGISVSLDPELPMVEFSDPGLTCDVAGAE